MKQIRNYFLFFCFIMMLSVNGQPRKNFSEKKDFSYFGIYFTGDGAYEYTAPSFLFGTEVSLNHRVSISAYAQYFSSKFDHYKIYAITAAVLGQVYLLRNRNLFVGIGMAYQRAEETTIFIGYPSDLIDFSIITLAYRLGYKIDLKKYSLFPEISLTGPFNDEGYIFTFTSIGLRITPKSVRKIF